MSSPTLIFVTEQLKEALRINKINPDSYGPAYGGESACLDLYYTGPNQEVWPIRDPDSGRGRILLPTGLHIALQKDRVGLVIERSSITKTNLKVRAGCIDAGYTGMIFVNCVHLNDEAAPHYFTFGDKLPFQLLITTTFNQFQQLSPDEWERYLVSSARQDGCVGSSDAKK
jgi:dUTPase